RDARLLPYGARGRLRHRGPRPGGRHRAAARRATGRGGTRGARDAARLARDGASRSLASPALRRPLLRRRRREGLRLPSRGARELKRHAPGHASDRRTTVGPMPPSEPIDVFAPDILKDEVAFVTGGGTGIGKQIARVLG